MGSIRRSLGAFACAALMAAVFVSIPVNVHAKGPKTSDPGAFCTSLASTIAYVNTLSEPTRSLLLASLEPTYAAYCSGN
jgi:hypothetical protein